MVKAIEALEGPSNPVCRVEVDFPAPGVWMGVYGGAIITQGRNRVARTQDGGTHEL